MDTGGVYSAPPDPERTLRLLGVDSENGLTQSEAEIRLDRNGPNSLPESDNDGIFHVLIEQVREPMILILIVIGLIYL
ncbi:MAG: cation-transporting P-type ATPase, partial [Candidatus Thermoplasmatota archaeon]|nr:cation-transporting P-type ATPase [Candidatus Thermoplasmatota archaeon]